MYEGHGNIRLKDIAENLGLSIGTVQRALNNKGGYTPETQKKVLGEAKRLGYIVNPAASALRRMPIKIAVLLPVRNGQRRFFFNYAWEGILNAEKEFAVYNINFLNREVEQGADEFENLLLDGNLKGIITNTHTEPRIQKVLQELIYRGIPVYTIDGDPMENLKNCNFKITVPHQGDLAADIFKNYLHNNVGTVLILSGSKKTQRQTKRSLDFCNAMAKKCPNASVLEFHMIGDAENIQIIVKNLIESIHDLIGIYSVSALGTVEMCKIIRDLHKSRELVTVGTDIHFDMLPYFEDDTLLSTIFQNPTTQGYQALKLMVAQIIDPGRPPEELIIPPSIVFKSVAEDFCSSKILN